MRIRVDVGIRADHEEVGRLVAEGFAGVGLEGVEVHVRAARRAADAFTGRAYFRLPSRPRLHPETRFLVVLVLPRWPRNRGYPKSHRYPRRKTAPVITVADWRERLVALAAHEACHVRQFRGGLRRSEVEAERWALRVLHAYRSARGGEAPGRVRARPRRRRDSVERLLAPVQLALFPAVGSGPAIGP